MSEKLLLKRELQIFFIYAIIYIEIVDEVLGGDTDGQCGYDRRRVDCKKKEQEE